ncbi:MAG: PAS domain S-box protein, partial [Sulfuricella sp.]|nr:PAS domain S-box protein [Sulfuricella sp.]
QAGFIMSLPVYRNGLPHATPAERRASLAGWVYAPFRMNDLMNGLLGNAFNETSAVFDLEIYDGEQLSAERRMYDSNVLSSGSDEGLAKLFQSVRHIEIAGHTWSLLIHSLPAFEARLVSDKSRLILAAGGGGSVLLALVVWLLVGGRMRAQSLAERMNHDLLESEARFRAMADSAPVLIWVAGTDMQCTWFNQTWLAFTGRTLGQERGEGWVAGVFPEDRAGCRASYRAAFARREPFRMEYRLKRHDGKYRWVLDSGVPRFDSQGEFTGYIGSCIDVSENREAVEALHESERTLHEKMDEQRALLENAMIGIALLIKRNFVWTNHKMDEMLGYGPYQMAGMSAEAIYPNSEDFQELGEAAYPLLAEGGCYSVERQLKRRDGTLFWASMSGKAIDPEDIGKGSFWIVQDISDRRRAEEALRDSEKRFRSMFQNHSSVMLLIDPHSGWIEDANQAAAGFYGYPVETLRTMKITEINTMSPEAVAAERQRALLHQRNDFVFIHRLADGSLRNVEVHSSPVLVAGHEQLFSIIHDITERKQAESALRDSEERWNMALEGSGDGVWDWDMQSGAVFFSKRWKEMLGYAEAEISGDVTEWERRVHPDDRESVEQALRGYLDGQLPTYACEHRVQRKDGSWIWILDRGKVVSRDAAGEPLRMVGTHTDISRLKEVQGQLRLFNENLEQRVAEEVARNMESERLLIQQSRLAAMGEMIGNIAHQWRQPLNALALLLANIKDAYDFDELDETYLATSVVKGNQFIQKMSTTIDDFRNFFRPNKLKQDFNLTKAVDDALSLVSHSLSNHNIEVRQIPSGDILAHGFPNEFSQVLLNVLNNAKDAILENQPNEGVVTLSLGEDSEGVWVEVGDNAGGIPDKVMPKIFDPYFTTKEKGTGIGLYMSRMIMAHMDGDIEARNDEEGAVFRLVLPKASLDEA